MYTENVTTNTPQNNVANLRNGPKYLGYLEKNSCWVSVDCGYNLFFFGCAAPRIHHGIFTLYLNLLGNPKNLVGTSKFLTMQ